MEHRNSELIGENYRAAIMRAGDDKPDGLIVAVVQDEKTKVFGLPPLIRAYVELKSNLQPS
jgi:hypothetical protein